MTSNVHTGSPAGSADPMALEAARAYLRAHGEVEAPALGRSMGGAFEGAQALVVATLQGRPRVGEVVVYERAGRWVAHRLLGCWRGSALTQGDRLWQPDWPPCRMTALEGRVVAVVRAGRRLPVRASRLRVVCGWMRALAWLISRLWRR
jgi:hypothetical protein